MNPSLSAKIQKRLDLARRHNFWGIRASIGTLDWYARPRVPVPAPRSNRSGTSYPHLQRRGGRYYFRLKIPKDLIEDYPRRALKRFLGW